jgi:reductive dehalogenase
VLYYLTGATLCVLTAWFAVTSVIERKTRATLMSSGGLILVGLAYFSPIIWWSPPDWVLGIPIVLVAGVALLWFVPAGSLATLRVDDSGERFDERDTIFAREEYLPGSEKYAHYYAAHPENKETDDKLRRLPELLAPGGKFYDPARSQAIKSMFSVIRQLTTQVDGEISDRQAAVEPNDITPEIKELVLRLGADEVGVARLDRKYVYSHVGRGPEEWGKPITNDHSFAIVFTLEMSYDQVEAAPDLPITEETARQYLRGALISVSLARFIRSLGYPARAHISESNYQIILAAVAHDAGLGELGRLGYLISPTYGARIRLGGVTTDLPLLPDRPITFGVQNFCDRCLKCAVNCPSGAIPGGSRTAVRGIEKWQLNAEQCLTYWRLAGTDCGLCMKVCPFSHPPTFLHNRVRSGISRSSLARALSVWGDDLMYGRKPARAYTNAR